MGDFGMIHGDFAPDGASFPASAGFPANNNGRVADVGAGTGPPAAFQLFSDGGPGASGASGGGSSFMKGTMARVWDSDGLDGTGPGRDGPTDIFMSKANVDAVQDAIRYRVWVETDGKRVIGRQSDAELALVMRSILLQRGRNDAKSDWLEQVRELNAEVLAWCVPRIVNEVGAYVRYRQDVSTLPVPMAHGGLATTKGDRQIEFKSFF